MNFVGLVSWLLAITLSPLLLGIINRTKAFFAGRRGAPLLQPYFDCWKLIRKGAVYSRTTTWVFRSGPVAGLAAVLAAAALVPLGSMEAAISFPGDLVFFAYLLGLMRFMTVVAALDTGSSFEGMGASREVWYSALAEPALLIGLSVLARESKSLSLSGMISVLPDEIWARSAIILILLVVALFIVLLAENARIPVDDPNTHLELTMIHEVMVLDHSGPDFCFIQYGAALKLWVLSALLTGIMIPVRTGFPLIDGALVLAGMGALAVLVGIIESCMARLQLVRVPQLLIGAGAFSTLALILALR